MHAQSQSTRRTDAHVSFSRLLSLDGQKAAIQRLSAYPAGKDISLSANYIALYIVCGS